jgi:hypothetical protein
MGVVVAGLAGCPDDAQALLDQATCEPRRNCVDLRMDDDTYANERTYQLCYACDERTDECSVLLLDESGEIWEECGTAGRCPSYIEYCEFGS